MCLGVAELLLSTILPRWELPWVVYSSVLPPTVSLISLPMLTKITRAAVSGSAGLNSMQSPAFEDSFCCLLPLVMPR